MEQSRKKQETKAYRAQITDQPLKGQVYVPQTGKEVDIEREGMESSLEEEN